VREANCLECSRDKEAIGGAESNKREDWRGVHGDASTVVAGARFGPARGYWRAARDHGSVSYFNNDPKNVRNVLEWGWRRIAEHWVLSDYYYPVDFWRRALASGGIDRTRSWNAGGPVTSAMMDFPSGQAVFTCSTQMVPYQRMQFFGTKGRIELKIPFNAPVDRPCEILIDDGRDVFGGGIATEEIPTCDQYTIQGMRFRA